MKKLHGYAPTVTVTVTQRDFNEDHDPDSGVSIANPASTGDGDRASFGSASDSAFGNSFARHAFQDDTRNIVGEDDKLIHYADGSMKRKAKAGGRARTVKMKVGNSWVTVPVGMDRESVAELIAKDAALRSLLGIRASSGPPPNLSKLMRWADCVPRGSKAQIKAMAADYEHDARELHAAGRPKTAKWNCFMAWCTAIGYVFAAPLDIARDYIVGAFKAK